MTYCQLNIQFTDVKNDTVKKILIGILVIGVLAGLVFLIIDKLKPNENEPIKRETPQIVLKGPKGLLAKVGDIEVKSDVFYKMLSDTKIESMMSGFDLDDPKNSNYLFYAKQDLINRLVEAAVYEDYAVKNGLLPTASEIKKVVNEEIEAQIKEAGSQKQFEKSIEEMGGIEQLRKNMESDAILKSKIIRQKVSDHITKTLEISKEQAKEFFDSKLLGVSQIVVLYEESIDGKEIFEETKKYAEDIRSLIGKNGKSFSDIAYMYSEDRETGQNGGRYDQLIAKETLSKKIADVLWSLNVGDVSPVLQLDQGFYVYKVDYQTFVWQYFFDEKKTGQKPDFEKIVDQVIQQLRLIKSLEHENEWFDKYRQSIKIDVYVDLMQMMPEDLKHETPNAGESDKKLEEKDKEK